MRTFNLLVANTLVASVTNNFVWFALTFWVYLETRSVLATAIIVLRGRLLWLATVLSLLFMVGTLLALVLALTVGLFGIHEVLSFKLVPTTLVAESIGSIILAVTVALALRSRRTP